MATNDYYDNTIRFRLKRTYTLSEAADLMKILDKLPTNKGVNWVSAKTGRPVSIGYTN